MRAACLREREVAVPVSINEYQGIMDCDERSQRIYADHVRVHTRMSDHVALAVCFDNQTTHKAPLDFELQRSTAAIPTCRKTEDTSAVARVVSAHHCVPCKARGSAVSPTRSKSARKSRIDEKAKLCNQNSMQCAATRQVALYA